MGQAPHAGKYKKNRPRIQGSQPARNTGALLRRRCDPDRTRDRGWRRQGPPFRRRISICPSFCKAKWKLESGHGPGSAHTSARDRFTLTTAFLFPGNLPSSTGFSLVLLYSSNFKFTQAEACATHKLVRVNFHCLVESSKEGFVLAAFSGEAYIFHSFDSDL